MGSIRLGTLPDTKPWRRVVARIADGASAAAVAAATAAAAVADAVDRWFRTSGHDRTDLADLAALEALTRTLGGDAASLFPGPDDVRRAARRRSTPAGFRGLAQEFLAAFARRYLLYHLGRELPLHAGGNGRFADRAAHAAFLADLDAHCREVAVVGKRFAEDWYAKAGFLDGVSEPRAAGFAAHLLEKLRDQLAARGAAGG